MKIKYVGLAKAVLIPATRQVAEQGKPVDVEPKVAQSLLKQSTWEKVTEKKKDSDEG